jgi:hypothetical protein
MRWLLILIMVVFLCGCANSPQEKQYMREYSSMQNLRMQNTYYFRTEPIKKNGDHQDLASFFYVSDESAVTVKFDFNLPEKKLTVSSLDVDKKVIREQVFTLLDDDDPESTKGIGEASTYIYLTKKGELIRKTKNCTPDMSVGCTWWSYTFFLTHQFDLALLYNQGGAGLAFLIIPLYNDNKYFEIYPKSKR